MSIRASYTKKIKLWDRSVAAWQALYDLGLNLIPAVAYQKTPTVKFKSFIAERITQEEWNWWLAKYKSPFSMNMLLLTGERNGLVLVDADDAEAEELVKARCPETPLLVKTRKGWHRYYRHPGHYTKQIIGVVIGGKKYKLDVKGEGGYGVAPYSYRECGHCYEWDTEWTAELIAAAPVYDPAWLPHEGTSQHVTPAGDPPADLDHAEFIEDGSLAPAEDRIGRAKMYLDAVPGCKAGSEDVESKVLKLSGKLLWGFALPADDALELLSQWGRRRDQVDDCGAYYPWELKELRHKISEALKAPGKYTGTPGDKAYPSAAEHEARQTADDYERVHEVVGSYDPDHLEDELGKDEPEVGKPANPKEDKRRFYSLDDIFNFPDPTWLVHDHLPETGLCGVFGPSGHGKTFYVLDMALSCACGVPFLDKFPVKQVPVLYILGEGRGGVKKRLRGWFANRGIAPTPEIKKNIFFSFTRYNLQDFEEAKDILNRSVTHFGRLPGLIVVDTLTRNFGGGDMDNNKEMNLFIKNANYMVEETGGVVLPIHHTGNYNTEREMGAVSFRNNLDTSFRVSGKDILEVECKKQKDAAEIEKYLVTKTLRNSTLHLEWAGPKKDVQQVQKEHAVDGDLGIILKYIPTTTAENAITHGITQHALSADDLKKSHGMGRRRLEATLEEGVKRNVIQTRIKPQKPKDAVFYFRDALLA